MDPPNVNIIVSPENAEMLAGRYLRVAKCCEFTGRGPADHLSLGRGVQIAIAYFDRLPRHTDILLK